VLRLKNKIHNTKGHNANPPQDTRYAVSIDQQGRMPKVKGDMLGIDCAELNAEDISKEQIRGMDAMKDPSTSARSAYPTPSLEIKYQA